MNGREMLEALGYIDEKYIDDAARAPKRRRNRWILPLAGAACAGIVLLAAWQLTNYQSKSAESIQLAAQDTAAVENRAAEPAIASYSMDASPAARSAGTGGTEAAAATAVAIPCEMTVQLVRQQDGTALCTVVDPGTGAFQVGQQLQIAWNQAESTSVCVEADVQIQKTEEPDGTESSDTPKTFVITYLPTEETVISPMSISPVEE